MNASKKDLGILTPEEMETLIWTDVDYDKEIIGFRYNKYFTTYKACNISGYMRYDDFGHTYLLTPEMVSKYASSIERLGFYPATIYGCMTEDKDIFFIPIVDSKNSIQMKYNEKFMTLIDAGNKAWVKIQENYCSDVSDTGYETAPLETFPYSELKLSPDEMERLAFEPMFIVGNEQHFLFKGIKLIPD